jgi:hypothetical protein
MELQFIQIAVAQAHPESRGAQREHPDLYGLTADGRVYWYSAGERAWMPLAMTAYQERPRISLEDWEARRRHEDPSAT